MSDNASTQGLRAAALHLAEADPLSAARILATGARQQPSGGRVALLRVFVAELIKHDPSLAAAIAAELAVLTQGAPRHAG